MNDRSARGGFPGLSPEEKNDLEEMIRACRSDEATNPEGASEAAEGSRQQIEELNERLTFFARIILELDERINVLYEVARLAQVKTDLISTRVENLTVGLNGRNGRRVP